MSHKWTGCGCLVAHFDVTGEMLPPCKQCAYCGYVPYPYDKECKGPQPQNNKELETLPPTGQSQNSEATS
jgi:hypothetical protein